MSKANGQQERAVGSPPEAGIPAVIVEVSDDGVVVMLEVADRRFIGMVANTKPGLYVVRGPVGDLIVQDKEPAGDWSGPYATFDELAGQHKGLAIRHLGEVELVVQGRKAAIHEAYEQRRIEREQIAADGVVKNGVLRGVPAAPVEAL